MGELLRGAASFVKTGFISDIVWCGRVDWVE